MYHEIITFWFEEIQPAQWWKKDGAFDQQINERFAPLYRQAEAGELYSWRDEPLGRLAEVIILDQFSRNMFRGEAQSFAMDGMALALSQEAIRCGADKALKPVERSFLYMPFMHSESLLIHQQSTALFNDVGIEGNISSARQHRDIIERFGRYPHRNQILWRDSTQEEMEFLEQPGSHF